MGRKMALYLSTLLVPGSIIILFGAGPFSIVLINFECNN
jgi:hypothetical protein